jgi:type II secretory pathway predicted ATPase ExeA
MWQHQEFLWLPVATALDTFGPSVANACTFRPCGVIDRFRLLIKLGADWTSGAVIGVPWRRWARFLAASLFGMKRIFQGVARRADNRDELQERRVAVLETYRHFGLSAAPFDERPDPRVFYETPSFAETLATLQFAVGSGKACTLVLGESGSGKTLLGRLLVLRIGLRSDVLWVRGLGQPPGKTIASVVRAAEVLTAAAAPGTDDSTEISLMQWPRTARTAPLRRQGGGATLIVDDADRLRANAWEDILSLVADPQLKSGATRVTAAIFGLPTLLDAARLEPRPPRGGAHNPFVRLERRLFRICRLLRLTGDEVAGYVRHRIAVAGGRAGLFTPSALALLYELSEGNPALVNQLCDNALVEAFGDDRPCVDVPHILAAARSITGQAERQDQAVDPALRGAATPSIHEESLLLSRLRSIAGSASGDPFGDRLHSLQARLTEALSRVRAARQPEAIGGPVLGQPPP